MLGRELVKKDTLSIKMSLTHKGQKDMLKDVFNAKMNLMRKERKDRLKNTSEETLEEKPIRKTNKL